MGRLIFHQSIVAMGMDGIARLKPGVTIEQARADMDSVARNLASAYPKDDSDVGATVVSLKEKMVGEIRPYLLVLLAAVFFVLLISCVSVANLMLARSNGRAREFAIRTALGASQARVIRQLLTESVLLSLCGGALGLILAAWGTQAALSLLPESLPRAEEIGLDGRVLIFTLAVSVLAGVIFGLAPALRTARPDVQETLKEGGRGASTAKRSAQNVFVVMELAMALVLLVGAGLMIRSLTRLWSVSPGFDPKNVLYFQVGLSPSMKQAAPDAVRYFEGWASNTDRHGSERCGSLQSLQDRERNGWRRESDLRRLHDTLATIPGMQQISIQRGGLPMWGDSEDPFWIEGQTKPARHADMRSALWYEVEPDYLKVMGIPLIRGRFFTAQDNESSPLVAVIDESFAEKYFPHDEFMSRAADSTGVLIRTQGEPLALVGAKLIATTKSFPDPLAERWFSMVLLGIFAALALVLSSIGIYGVISYVVGQRTHEIGIRIALGAQRKDVLALVLREGTRTALLGVGIGLIAALGLTRLMVSVLYGVSAIDPLTFVAVAGVLAAVALAACYIPARRAMRVDPIVALRYE
jgi:hypothetical protein